MNQKKKTMILGGTKDRILQYLKIKNISKPQFYSDLGIKRGLLDADKMNATVTDVIIAKIIVVYTDINPVWLLTGEGAILKNESSNPEITIAPTLNKQTSTSQQENVVPYILYEKLQEKLCEQATTIGKLQNELDNLKKQQQESLTTNSISHAETVQKKRSSSRISDSSAQPDAPIK